MTDGRTDGRTDRQTEMRWLRRATAEDAVARKNAYYVCGLFVTLSVQQSIGVPFQLADRTIASVLSVCLFVCLSTPLRLYYNEAIH